jgi:hypothetical protein
MAVTKYMLGSDEVRFVGSKQRIWINTVTGKVLTDAEVATVVTSTVAG